MRKCGRYGSIIGMSLLLAGCAMRGPSPVSLPPPPPPPEPMPTARPPVEIIEGSAATPPVDTVTPPLPPGDRPAFISLTPFTDLAWTGGETKTRAYSDAYTRLVIDSAVSGRDSHGERDPDAQVIPLTYARRNWFLRYLVAKHYTANLSVRVSTENFTATVPLVTIDHISDDKGEKYLRAVYHRAEAFPLFLVHASGGGGVVSMRFALKVTSDTQSAVAAKAIQLVTTAASAVAPQSRVVTALTAQGTRNLSDAIDNAVGQLFGLSLDEEQWTDRDIRYWQPGQGVSITLRIPKSERDWQGPVTSADWTTAAKSLDALYTVGTWTVGFDEPRASIFSDRRLCSGRTGNDCLPRPEFIAAIPAAEVLSFALVGGGDSHYGSVRSYLSQLDWYPQVMSALQRTPGAEESAQFCRRIRSAMTDLGLNALDAAIVVDAARRGLPLPPGAAAAMATSQDCIGPG